MKSKYEPGNLCNCVWFAITCPDSQCGMDHDQEMNVKKEFPEDCEDFTNFDEAVDSVDFEKGKP